ncbi:MAG: class I SAM-dependent methyltransferase, partial [Patescibacteria group bacterium]
DVHELIPKYIRPNQPVRLFGDYVMPQDPNFELNLFTVLRAWLFKEYLSGAEHIFEFGCGPAYNLVELARMYPDKKLHGLEWVSPPLEIIRLLAEKRGYKITGQLFDMFVPDDDLAVGPNSAFLAIWSLEQLGERFEKFLQFSLQKSPAIFVHVDAFLEFCRPNNLSDYLALKHNLRRSYLRGYLTRLYALEAEGKIEIIKAHKVECGGLYHDAHSYVVWRPKKVNR